MRKSTDTTIDTDIELLQRHQLDGLLDHGYRTEFGKKYGFRADWSYDEFVKHVPLTTYGTLQPYIEKLKRGAADQLWEGKTHRFAVSSGTTGEGKHLPITDDRLHSDRIFLRQLVRYALTQSNPFRLLAGKHLSLPGSLEHQPMRDNGDDIIIGEISGHLADISPSWLSWFQSVPIHEMIQLSFNDKFERALSTSIEQDIRVINAVPSWTLILFQEVLEQTGKSTVSDIWPNLQLILGGGVAMRNYAEPLRKLYGKPINFIETYGASEGYFAYGGHGSADPLNKTKDSTGDLNLVVDNGIFYEFLPITTDDEASSKTPVPLWKVKTDTSYSLIVSTNAGLWRYELGDIIQFTQHTPPKIRVTGRKDDMLDDYGEALRSYEADQTIAKICRGMNLPVSQYAVGALRQDPRHIPIHHWFLFCDESLPADKFAKNLDEQLQKVNRHYQIRRESGALDHPKVWRLPEHTFRERIPQQNVRTAQSKPRSILKTSNEVLQLLTLTERGE